MRADGNVDLEQQLAARIPEADPGAEDALEAERNAMRGEARAFLELPAEASLEEIQAEFAASLWKYWTFFFPDYRLAPDGTETAGAPFQEEFCADIQELVIAGRPGQEEARAYPREHAKSVFASLVAPMWATSNRHRIFPIIFSDTFEQAADFLADIRIEAETNERLQAIYPEYCSWAAEPNRRRLSFGNGTWIMAAGSGKSVRGARQQAHRPDMIVLDDIENDEEVENPSRRRKKRRWYNRVVKKLGRGAVFLIVGTILHADSFLAQSIKSEADVHAAVVRFPAREDLWQRWEEIFHDRSAEGGEAAARVFYDAHRAAMNAGGRVLWPARFSLYGLMVERAEDLASFLSERQNQPFDPAASWFPEDRIQFLEGGDVPPVDDVAFSALFWDPSRGTTTSDTSALARLDVLKDGRRFISHGLAERMPPEEVMQVIIGWHKQRPFGVVGVEKVGLSNYEEQLMALADSAGIKLPVQPVTPSGSKDLRIKSMRPLIVAGAMVFADSLPLEAKRQVKFYSQHQNDDFPDAVQQANQLADEYMADVKPAGATIEPDDAQSSEDLAEAALGRGRLTPPRPRGGLAARLGIMRRAWR